ncbi:MAG: helix-turn-helix domain-containing protein [Acidibacillus sp.]|nr:helix-turn-helix domain-containing protein [Acidibacillus sp.]
MNVWIKDVLARAKAGDAKAMEDILLRFDRLIFKVSMDHGVVDEEIAQEVREEFVRKVRRRTEKTESHTKEKPAP